MSARNRLLTSTVQPWLWWSTFAIARASGNGIVSAFKRAQAAAASLHRT